MSAHIGALVEIELVVERQDHAVGIDRHARMVALLARMVRRHQVLATVLDPFDRAAEAQRGEADEEILGIELAADAEPAAGVTLLQHHRGGAAAEHARERVAIAVRHLGRAIQFQHIARGVVAGERAARLDRHGAVPADRQIERDDRMRSGKSGVDIAVIGPQHDRLGRKPGREAAGRRRGVEQRRQFVDRRP